jgi:hypothetical protein
MTTYEKWVKKKVLITVRTYPVPSRKSIEVSCTAGITEDGKWIRLFPVPYRFLTQDKRFTKYQYIEAEITKSRSDSRPESYKINIDTIQILDHKIPTDTKWEKRKELIYPLKSISLCSLQAERDLYNYPTLGFIKPRIITGFKIETTRSQWNESELTSLRQYPLFDNVPQYELQKLPYTFSYQFKCEAENCSGHEIECTDWEIGASFLKWRRKYGAKWEQKFRETYETEMTSTKETHFFVGTINNHPNVWLITGLFYPPK